MERKLNRWIKPIKVSIVLATGFLLFIGLLMATVPNWAFDKRTRPTPQGLEEDSSVQVVEYGWIKGSQLEFGDGAHGSSFDAAGLAYVSYWDQGILKRRWSIHLGTTTHWDNEMTGPGWKPKNVTRTITLR